MTSTSGMHSYLFEGEVVVEVGVVGVVGIAFSVISSINELI
jgi:hypothetical protein